MQELKDRQRAAIYEAARKIISTRSLLFEGCRVDPLKEAETNKETGWLITFRLAGRYVYDNRFVSGIVDSFCATRWLVQMVRGTIELSLEITHEDAGALLRESEKSK